MSGVSKLLAIKQCDNCSLDVEIRHKSRLGLKHIFCSRECYLTFLHENKKPYNAKCSFCETGIRRAPNHIKRHKWGYCSMKCKNKHDAILMSGENNHQYGLLGDKNDSWKSDIRITVHGYRKIRSLLHPHRDCDGFVLEHRLVAEEYLIEDWCAEYVNGVKYLSKNFDVHHKDFNKLNNDPQNLLILSRSEHISLHREIKRSSNNNSSFNGETRVGGIGSTSK